MVPNPDICASDSPPVTGGTGGECPECGTKLSGGACPACALGFLLGGHDQPADDNRDFGRYTLKHKLAAGGMGVVYVAEDRKLKRTVALKMIRGSTFADDEEVARFTLEAEAAAGLDHPNIVPIYEVGRLDGQPFFTMKLIEGQTLAKRLKENNGTLPAREVAALLSNIARAVHHAHQRGVLHRDLKPGNIIVDNDGVPWLTDFGLAKMASMDSGLTLTRDHIGTPHYMAPEVAGGNARLVSTASDVWALGVMLWEMLCGMPPFHGPGPVEIMRRIVTEEPSWPPGTKADNDLITIARRCMEKNPARRPQSAGELADELDRWQRGEPIKARPVTHQERLIKWVRREPAMAALYAVMLVALVTGFYLWQRAEQAVDSLTNTNERMEQNLLRATATKLAGDAGLQVQEDPNCALLLALESVKMTESTGVLPEAASALMSVLSKAGGWDASQGALQGTYFEAYISFREFHRRAAQISPDGRWLLSLNTNRWGEAPTPAAIYDMHDNENSRPLRSWNIWDGCEYIDVASACWLEDSRRLLTVDGQGRVCIQRVITSAMETGVQNSASPAMDDCGVLPLLEGFKLITVKPWAAGGRMGVTWMEVERKRRNAKDPLRVRMARMIVEDSALRDPVEFNTAGEWADGPVFAPCPRGEGGLVYTGEGSITPYLLDFSSGVPVQHALAVPGRRVRLATFDEGGKRVALHLSNDSICAGALPEPGAPSREIALRHVMDYPAHVRRMALSPDGRWLAAVGDSTKVLVVSLDDEKAGPVAQYFTSGYGTAVKFSPDSQWLAAGGKGRAVHLWRMDTIRSGTPPVLLHGLPTTVAEIAFSHDNSSVAAVAFASAVRRWNFDGVSGAAMPQRLPVQDGVLKSTVSPDGAWAAAACDTVTETGEPGLPVVIGQGALVLTRLNGRSRLELDSFGAGATGVAFSSNGRWLAAAGRDATVKVWDFAEAAKAADGGQPAPAPRHVIPVEGIRTFFQWSLAFHPDGRLYMVNGDGVLFCWDADAADPAATQRTQVIHSIRYMLPDVAVSPDGKYLAAGRHGWDRPRADSDQFGSQVLLFDVSARDVWPPKRVATLQSDFLEYTSVAFSPDNRWLASGGTGYEPSLWDLHAPDIAASRIRPPVRAHLMSGVSFSPDSRRLALGAADGQLYLWDWRPAGDIRTIQTDFGIKCATWLPDGHLLVSGASDRLALWDTDLTRLQALARRVAGRELNSGERARFRVP